MDLLKSQEDSLDDLVAAGAHTRKCSFPLRTHPSVWAVPHHRAPAMQANFNVLFRKVERCRSFGCTKLLDISKHDDTAVLAWQFQYRFFQKLA